LFENLIINIEDNNPNSNREEENKIEDQLSQSTISGKPSPFINNESELNFLTLKKEKMIRNKS